jgi:hypothetical protein
MPVVTKAMLEAMCNSRAEENARLVRENIFLKEKLEFYKAACEKSRGYVIDELIHGIALSTEASAHVISDLRMILERKGY